MGRHTHLSDGKLQDSSIVHSHMDRSICFVKEKDIIYDKMVAGKFDVWYHCVIY